MRAVTLGLSIAGHLALGAALALLATREAPAPRAATTIELVDVSPSPIATAEVSLGGGSHTGEGPAVESAPRVIARPIGVRVARGEVALVDANRRAMARDDAERFDPRGEIRVENARGVADGDGEGGGTGGREGTGGEGSGAGTGRGRGIGLGDGARISEETVALVTPPPPAASKARVAKLVYPVREREVDDAELFVARVTIDDEGFVVGAKLVRGFGGPRDAMAADLIWKFRYAPALDDEGRPILSTLDQRFLVGQ